MRKPQEIKLIGSNRKAASQASQEGFRLLLELRTRIKDTGLITIAKFDSTPVAQPQWLNDSGS